MACWGHSQFHLIVFDSSFIYNNLFKYSSVDQILNQLSIFRRSQEFLRWK
jgi:hypothetical protein